MTADHCETCGRRAENGTPAHWLGCPGGLRAHARNLVEPDLTGSLCEHDGCSKPKREWSGRGARPKYCADGHK
ncbi:hypothetical protein [Streptomyces tsukubensis]|uniref:hypothetical protein n=1 Tax=Streptomyces tsukubensis TaxID=83656 RepID=UPI00344ED6F2